MGGQTRQRRFVSGITMGGQTRQRRFGHSGPPTGNFNPYPSDSDSSDDEEELMLAVHRRQQAKADM